MVHRCSTLVVPLARLFAPRNLKTGSQTWCAVMVRTRRPSSRHPPHPSTYTIDHTSAAHLLPSHSEHRHSSRMVKETELYDRASLPFFVPFRNWPSATC